MTIFLRNTKGTHHKLLEQNDSTFTQTFLFGDLAYNVKTNTSILNLVIQYVLSTKRFEVPNSQRISLSLLIAFCRYLYVV